MLPSSAETSLTTMPTLRCAPRHCTLRSQCALPGGTRAATMWLARTSAPLRCWFHQISRSRAAPPL